MQNNFPNKWCSAPLTLLARLSFYLEVAGWVINANCSCWECREGEYSNVSHFCIELRVLVHVIP